MRYDGFTPEKNFVTRHISYFRLHQMLILFSSMYLWQTQNLENPFSTSQETRFQDLPRTADSWLWFEGLGFCTTVTNCWGEEGPENWIGVLSRLHDSPEILVVSSTRWGGEGENPKPLTMMSNTGRLTNHLFRVCLSESPSAPTLTKNFLIQIASNTADSQPVTCWGPVSTKKFIKGPEAISPFWNMKQFKHQTYFAT